MPILRICKGTMGSPASARLLEIKKEYMSTLSDLTINSKPYITLLTELARENIDNAQVIVEAVEEHLLRVRVESKLPILYLIDSIVKTIGRSYVELFLQNIVANFCHVFEKVDEKTREQMFKLRQTWTDVLPDKKLYALDCQVKCLDPAWPFPTTPVKPTSIHINPKMFNKSVVTKSASIPTASTPNVSSMLNFDTNMLTTADPELRAQLIKRQQELIKLQEQKIQLEIMQAKLKLEEQQQKQSARLHGEKSRTKISEVESKNLLLKPGVLESLNENSSKTVLTQAAATTKPIRIAPVNATLVKSVRELKGRTGGSVALRDPRQAAKLHVERYANVDSNIIDKKRPIELKPNKTNDKTEIVLSNQDFGQGNLKNKDPRLRGKSPVNDHKRDKGDKIKSKRTASSRPSPNHIKIDDVSGKSREKAVKHGGSHSRKSPSQKDSSNIISNNPKLGSLKSSASVSGNDADENLSEKKIKSDKGSSEHRRSSESSTSSTSPQKSSKKRKHRRAFNDKIDSVSKGDDKSSKRSDGKKRDHVDVSSSSDESVVVVASLTPQKRPRIDSKSQAKAEDVDLRLAVKNDVVNIPKTLTIEAATKDVDLRELPTSVNPTNANRGQKRPSPAVDPRTKKPKSNGRQASKVDGLFGNEDVDLRSISLADALEASSDTKIKENATKGKLSLAAARAKLAGVQSAHAAATESPLNDVDNRVDPRIKRDDERATRIPTPPMPPTLTDNINKSEFRRRTPTPPLFKRRDKPDKDRNRRKPRNDPPQSKPSPWLVPPVWDSAARIPIGPLAAQIVAVPTLPVIPAPVKLAETGCVNIPTPWLPYEYSPANPPPLLGQTSNKALLPPADPKLLAYIDLDVAKTINIDGEPRAIRHYDYTAAVVMTSDDVREISFQDNERAVFIDNLEPIILAFNAGFVDVPIHGVNHKLKLGTPSRELYIDNNWYECFFGGPPLGIEIDGKICMVRLDGPPPTVKFGMEKRRDLCAGRVDAIVNGNIVESLFLDAKPQKIVIGDDTTLTVRFVDALKTVLINEVAFRSEFGQLPKRLTTADGKQHYIRFSTLPSDVQAGSVNIFGMEGYQPTILSSILSTTNETSENSIPNVLNVISSLQNPSTCIPGIDDTTPSDDTLNTIQDHSSQTTSSIIDSEPAPSLASNISTKPHIESRTCLAQNQMTNINDLFQKLITSGIVSSLGTVPVPTMPTIVPTIIPTTSTLPSVTTALPIVKPQKKTKLHTVNLKNPGSLKTKQPAIAKILYSGMQCSSCGVRFPPEQTIKYSQHLDWHFRQNRKERSLQRKASSRRWYYSIPDWIQYEEIEDLDEREKNWFENQQQDENSNHDDKNQTNIPGIESFEGSQTVEAKLAGENPRCDVCHDSFDQFYDEERDEWHLRNAKMGDNGKIYHSLCYDDFMKSAPDLSISLVDLSNLKETVTLNDELEAKEVENNEPESKDKIEDSSEEHTNNDESKELTKNEIENLIDEPINDKQLKDDIDVDMNASDPDVCIIEPEVVKVINIDDTVDDDDDEDNDKHNEENGASVEIDSNINEVSDDSNPENAEKSGPDYEQIIMQDGTVIKIKSEPIDTDYDVPSDAILSSTADTTHAAVVSSIDGNVEIQASEMTNEMVTNTIGKIKINIGKSFGAAATSIVSDKTDEKVEDVGNGGENSEKLVEDVDNIADDKESEDRVETVSLGQRVESSLCAIM